MHKKSMKLLLADNRKSKGKKSIESNASKGRGSGSIEEKLPSKIDEHKPQQSPTSDKSSKSTNSHDMHTMAGVAGVIVGVKGAENRTLHKHHKSGKNEYSNEEEEEEVEEEEDEEEAVSSDSILGLGIGVRVYESVVAAFEKNRNKEKDISAALIVALNKKGNQRKKNEFSQFLYHHVELSEKPDTPEPPSTPLWKKYRWKAWAIKKGIISKSPDAINSSENNSGSISETKLEGVSSDTVEETSGGRETPESTGSGDEEMAHLSDPTEETNDAGSNSRKSTLEDNLSLESRIEGHESEESVETKLTNSEDDEEEEEDEEDEVEEEDEDNDDETEPEILVECVQSEMYEALKNTFEAHIRKDATAALIIAVNKQPKNQGVNTPEKSFNYLCHPVELKEIVTEKPSTPLWKTFRWKAWAAKKGLLEPEITSQVSEDSKEMELSLDSREDENEIDSVETLIDEEESCGTEESGEEECLYTREEVDDDEDEDEISEEGQQKSPSSGYPSTPSNAGGEREESGSGNIMGSEETGKAEVVGDLGEYGGESDVEVNSLRSTQAITEIQKRRNRISLQQEAEEALQDRLILESIVEKLKKTDLKSYCQRYMQAQEEKRMKEEEQKNSRIHCSSSDSIDTKCSSSSDDIESSHDLKTKISNKTKLSLESSKSLIVIQEEKEFSSDGDIPTNVIGEDLAERDGEEADLDQNEMESKISIVISKLIDSLEQSSIDNLRKTSLEIENSTFTNKKHSKKDSLPAKTTSINLEKSKSGEGEKERKDKSIISSKRKGSASSDKMSLEHHRVSNKTPPVHVTSPISENMIEITTSPIRSDSGKPLLEGKLKSKKTKKSLHKKKVSLLEPAESLEGRENRKSTQINDDVIVIKDVERIPSTASNSNKNLVDDDIMADETQIECNDDPPEFQFSLSHFNKMAIKRNLANCKISLENDFNSKVTERKPIIGKASVHAIPERLKQYHLVASTSQIAINQSSAFLCDSKDEFDSPTRLSNFGSRVSSRTHLVGRSLSDITRKRFLTKDKINRPIPLDGSSITDLVKGAVNPIYCLSDVSSTSTCSQMSSDTGLLKQPELKSQESLEENETDEKYLLIAKSDESLDNLDNITFISNTDPSPSPRSELGERSLSGEFEEDDENDENDE